MSLPNPEKIAALKAEHGALKRVAVGAEDVIVRTPTRIEIKRFADEVDKRGKFAALENLCVACVVWPGRDEFAAMVEARAGLIVPLGDYVAGLAGMDADAEGKDL